MGKDDLFKKRRAERKQRREGKRTPKAGSYLIVTEGACTEPFYFEGIKEKIIKKIGGFIDIDASPQIDITGEGVSPTALVERADELVNKAKILYQNVWIVFDRDEFQDFDSAIALASSKGYNVAWSNQCFEFWLYLHFNYSDAALHRDDWYEKLDAIFKERRIRPGGYEKNLPDLYNLVSSYGDVKKAVAFAETLMKKYDLLEQKASECDPGTTVHLLVKELLAYLE